MKTVLLALFFSVCCAVPVSAASFDEVTPFLSGQYFTWDEHSGGRRLLKESGPLFSGGILLGVVTDFSLTLRGKAEIFGGEIGYNGETQAPNSFPVRTDVSYFGTRHEFDLGYRVSSGALRLEPFGGLGYRWWLRGLQNATSATGQRVSGYTEWWQTGYGRLGARGRYLMPSGVAIFAEGGAKYPFYTGNNVDFSNSGMTTFHPGGEWSGFAETGVTYRHLKLTLFYEGFRFSQSSDKQVGTQFFFQPESSSDIFGLSLGGAFR
jgi:hypothetical protein